MVAAKSLSPFEVFYQRGLLSLAEGTFSEFVKSNSSPTNVQKRIVAHLEIKKLMSEVNYQKTLIALGEARANFGEHISLLCDEACIYYLQNNFSVWAEKVDKIERRLVQVEKQLSHESLTKTVMLLAKFFEGLGHIRKAFRYLQKAEKISQGVLKIRVRANIVRLLSVHPISTFLSQYYVNLKQYAESETEFNSYAEFQHALILGETRLFGVNSITEGFVRLMSEGKINYEDSNLILYDVLQILMTTNADIPEPIKRYVAESIPKTYYEGCLKELILSNNTKGWINWASNMPLGEYFLLCSTVDRKLENSKPEHKTFRAQLELLLKSLPLAERRYWKSQPNVSSAEKAEKLRLQIDPKSKSVSVNGTKISFASRGALHKLLNYMVLVKRASLEDVTRELFAAEFNESYYHRLRRLVKRINDEFTSRFLAPPLKCSRSELEISY